MNIAKPTISGAVAGIVKATKQLAAVIDNAAKEVEKADADIGKATSKKASAAQEMDRAARIKAKLEELVA